MSVLIDNYPFSILSGSLGLNCCLMKLLSENHTWVAIFFSRFGVDHHQPVSWDQIKSWSQGRDHACLLGFLYHRSIVSLLTLKGWVLVMPDGSESTIYGPPLFIDWWSGSSKLFSRIILLKWLVQQPLFDHNLYSTARSSFCPVISTLIDDHEAHDYSIDV